jgi:L-lactate dehydrogenase complex protein LldE
MQESQICCGFGGTFVVKYDEISAAIVDKKAINIEASRALVLLAGDLGCLMNMAGRLSRRGSPIEVRHVAEILADMTDMPPIGRESQKQDSKRALPK